jgi:hypothetical protein
MRDDVEDEPVWAPPPRRRRGVPVSYTTGGFAEAIDDRKGDQLGGDTTEADA